MKVLVGSRGSGKTTRLIQIAHKNGYYIATRNKDMVRYTFDMARKLELEILFPITYEELMDIRGRNIKGIVIDDIDAFLSFVLYGRYPIKAFSVSSDDIEVRFLNPILPNDLVQG